MNPINRDAVRKLSRGLPGWPVAISEILNTLDDPDANYNELIRAIQRDPVITARVLWLANTAALRGQREAEVTDVSTAISLVGVSRVRHVVLISSLNTFAQGAQVHAGTRFWTHSVAVGVCAEELTSHVGEPVSASRALVAGLLHDVGQLCLYQADQALMQQCQQRSRTQYMDIALAEQEAFGVHHGTVGGWLAEEWHLPENMIDAIVHHHDPAGAPGSPLVDIVHLAEALTQALQLGGVTGDRVSTISAASCERLGLEWDDNSRGLFGRMEARTRHATLFFELLPSRGAPEHAHR